MSTDTTSITDSQSSTLELTDSGRSQNKLQGELRDELRDELRNVNLSVNLSRTQYIAQAGMIAALYAAATLITMLLLQGLAWGPVQFRISEALCVIAVFTPAAIPGLTIGCVIANVINMFVSGTGALGMLDVVFGSAATLIGAIICWKLRNRPAVAIGAFVLTNALIVPAYLPILLQGLGFYTIPFTDISIDGAYIPMYIFGVVATGIGEAAVIYILGLPIMKAIKRFRSAK